MNNKIETFFMEYYAKYNKIPKVYKIKIRLYNSNIYGYLSYPNRENFNYGFYGRANKSQAILVSELSIQRDILQLYLAYHDYILEEVKEVNNIPERLTFLRLEDFGINNDLYEKSKNGYCIQPSENDYLNGVFNNSKFYKLKNLKTNKWLSYNFIGMTNIDLAIIISDYCLQNDRLKQIINDDYILLEVFLPCTFSHIFYNNDDLDVYMNHVV